MSALLLSSPSRPSSPTLSSLANRVGHAFTAHTILRGFVCLTEGVELLAVSATRVEARVRSTPKKAATEGPYDVTLRRHGDVLLAACSCVTTIDAMPCEHVWAVLLEIDRRDAFEDLRRSYKTVLVRCAPRPALQGTGPHPSATPESELTGSGATGAASRVGAEKPATRRGSKADSASKSGSSGVSKRAYADVRMTGERRDHREVRPGVAVPGGVHAKRKEAGVSTTSAPRPTRKGRKLRKR